MKTIERWIQGMFFENIDTILESLTVILAKLGDLAKRRQKECEDITLEIAELELLAKAKQSEQERADRIKVRLEALLQ